MMRNLWQHLCLFCWILWRRIDSRVPDRLSWRCAWDIAFRHSGMRQKPRGMPG